MKSECFRLRLSLSLRCSPRGNSSQRCESKGYPSGACQAHTGRCHVQVQSPLPDPTQPVSFPPFQSSGLLSPSVYCAIPGGKIKRQKRGLFDLPKNLLCFLTLFEYANLPPKEFCPSLFSKSYSSFRSMFNYYF